MSRFAARGFALLLALLLGPAAAAASEREPAFERAERELEAGNLDAAERELRTLAERYDSPRALHRLAQLRWRRGDGEEAAKLMLEALDLAPSSTALLDTFARISLARRQPVPAIVALEALLRMRPSDREHSYLLGVARLQVGDMAGAVEVLEDAVERRPDEPLPWTALGLALNNLKRYAAARDALERAERLAPDSAETLAALAEALAGLGENEAAEAYARRALARDPRQPTAHLVQGLLRMEEGRYAAARDALEAALAGADGPASTKIHYQLSQAYARLGDAESSRRHVELYRRALEEREAHLLEIRRAGLGGAGSNPATPSAERP